MPIIVPKDLIAEEPTAEKPTDEQAPMREAFVRPEDDWVDFDLNKLGMPQLIDSE
jgi:hypothetical protein